MSEEINGIMNYFFDWIEFRNFISNTNNWLQTRRQCQQVPNVVWYIVVVLINFKKSSPNTSWRKRIPPDCLWCNDELVAMCFVFLQWRYIPSIKVKLIKHYTDFNVATTLNGLLKSINYKTRPWEFMYLQTVIWSIFIKIITNIDCTCVDYFHTQFVVQNYISSV